MKWQLAKIRGSKKFVWVLTGLPVKAWGYLADDPSHRIPLTDSYQINGIAEHGNDYPMVEASGVELYGVFAEHVSCITVAVWRTMSNSEILSLAKDPIGDMPND